VIYTLDETQPLPVMEEVQPTIHKPPKPVIRNPDIIEIKDDSPEVNDIDVEWISDIDVEPDDLGVIWEDIPVEEAENPVDLAEVMPSPAGGLKTFYEYIQKELKYPSKARRLGIQGSVYLVFVVNKNGEISDVEILKGIGGGCDEEAVRVLENAPSWNPGKQRGKPVAVRMRLPVIFKLQK
jgi:protein TonB